MKTLALLVLFGTAATVAAQNPTIDPSLQYLVLATQRTTTMQKELDVAASRGFRVVSGMPHDDEVVLLLDRVPQGSGPYSYQLLATNRTSTMEKELNQAGRDGFRLIPQTTLAKGDEVLLIMERDPRSSQRFEYKLLATNRTSTLQKELNEAGRAGFILKGTFSRDETMAVMERAVTARLASAAQSSDKRIALP
jgi:hypothetical protein